MDSQTSTYKSRKLKRKVSDRTGWYEMETALPKERNVQNIVQELAEMDKHLRRTQKLQQEAIEASMLVFIS